MVIASPNITNERRSMKVTPLIDFFVAQSLQDDSGSAWAETCIFIDRLLISNAKTNFPSLRVGRDQAAVYLPQPTAACVVSSDCV
jgi:hypothetical protein